MNDQSPRFGTSDIDVPVLTPHRSSTAALFLLLLGAISVVLSFFVSNYAGMGVAAVTALLATSLLGKSQRSTWTWVIGLAAIGFFIGLTAMLMKIIVMQY